MSRLRDQFFDTGGMDLSQLESTATSLCVQQRGIMWWIGDVALAAQRMGDDSLLQLFPEWVSPGMIQRCLGVARAYPKEADRNPEATWSQHMQVAKKPNRVELVSQMVSKGQTTDESRRDQSQKRWILCVDVNYFLHRFWYSGAGVESAVSLAGWVQRTAARLKEKGLTDVACCFDSKENHRKAYTEEWDDKYKDRPKKDDELVHQLHLVRELLKGHGFACVSVEGMEADDCMASFAGQFKGNITLLTQDKDCRQCLSDKCNMLLDVEWTEDESTGDMLPDYKWMTAKKHTEETGIAPGQWTEFQALMGDNVDGIKGCPGVGEKGAADLVKQFGSAYWAIQAAKQGDESIRQKKREALIEFEDKLEVTRKLVTLVTDLPLPTATRI